MTELEKKFKELRPLQQKECEILLYIDEFCKDNDIEYCLAYGSVLGAIRHGGPIPWDDDIDIYMTAKDYEKFRMLFAEAGDHERFYLQERISGGICIAVPKLRMNNTTYIEKSLKNKDIHQGIYVDIFVLDNCPPTTWQKKKAIIANMYMLLKKLSNDGYNKRKSVALIMWFLRLFPADFGLKLANRQMKKWNNDSTTEMLSDWGLYAGKPKWFLPRDIIFPAERVNYNGYTVCIPRNPERYLEICYGDWKTIPNINQISWAQHASQWSVTEDFRKFCPNIKTFADECI